MKVVARAVVFPSLVAFGALAANACANEGAQRAATGDTGAVQVDSTPATTKVANAAGAPSQPTGAAATPVAARPAAVATDPPAGRSVTAGVYTTAQATRGQEVYSASCAQCHTMLQHSGTTFATAWNGRRLYDLYDIVHNTMPLDNPGGLTEQEYVDVVAYMLQLNGVPAGKSALRADADALKGLRIDVKPSAGE